MDNDYYGKDIWDNIGNYCFCNTCDNEIRKNHPFFVRMNLCPECGNKRCPKATFHEHDCTGSNEAGQPGSAY